MPSVGRRVEIARTDRTFVILRRLPLMLLRGRGTDRRPNGILCRFADAWNSFFFLRSPTTVFVFVVRFSFLHGVSSGNGQPPSPAWPLMPPCFSPPLEALLCVHFRDIRGAGWAESKRLAEPLCGSGAGTPQINPQLHLEAML